MTTPTPARLPLLRPERGRVVAGVCQGIAAHLDVPVALVRAVTVGLALVGGLGVIGYGALWLLVPSGDPVQEARAQASPERARAARPPMDPRRELTELARRIPVRELAIGMLLLAVGASVVAAVKGTDAVRGWVVPVAVVGVGLLLTWSQLAARRSDASDASQSVGVPRKQVLWLVGGVALVVVGVLLLVAQRSRGTDLVTTTVAALAVLAGVAVAAGPWWLRLVADLQRERLARERADERAEIAAHLHDSVLQTLTLIQRNAQDPAAVTRMARTQERELRRWLYQDLPQEGTSVAELVRAAAAAVEDSSGVAVDVVTVGDVVPDEATASLLAAVREALINAVRHGAPPVSVYAEATGEAVEVSVRDHGPGFDPQNIAPDRFGYRESIVGRVTRRGGTVTIRRPADGGTEVRMVMPLDGSAPHGFASPEASEAQR